MDQSNTHADFTPVFIAFIRNPVKFRMYLLQKLPAAFFSGLSLKEVDEAHCMVTIPFKWFTKNPFRSTYFACLSMAAEMSTGILAMGHLYNRTPRVSMLVTSIRGNFYKKAIGKTTFHCKEGLQIREVIERAITLNAPQTIEVSSSGYNENNELIAEFRVVWSFKAR